MSLNYSELVLARSKRVTSKKNCLVVEVIQNTHEHFQREFLVNLQPKDDWVRYLEEGSIVFLLNKFSSGHTREFSELAPLGHQLQDYQQLAAKMPEQSILDFFPPDSSVVDVEAYKEPDDEESSPDLQEDSKLQKKADSIHIKGLEESFMERFLDAMDKHGYRYKAVFAKRLIEIALPIYESVHADIVSSQRRP
tara:strand:- start:204 stop:785 length:582 start_codon:yes stop_codon:yes gene_type:complete